MEKLIVFILAFTPLLCGAEVIDDLRARDPAACKGITIENNYWGLAVCAGELADLSRQKLNARLSAIRLALARINFSEYTSAFELSQNTWEKYKDEYCAYKTAEIDKQKVAYEFQLNICHAVENYRRLDALKYEPSIS